MKKYRKQAKMAMAVALATTSILQFTSGVFAKNEISSQEPTSEREENVSTSETKSSLEVESNKIEKQEEALSQEKQAMSYTLSKNKFIDIKSDVTSIRFTDEALPMGVTGTDISEAGDGSVLVYKTNGNLIVTTNTAGVNIKFPRNSSQLFESSTIVITIDLSNVDTSEVTNMQAMFKDCSSLTTLDVSGFDTSNVTNMDSMFNSCRSLTNLDVSSFNTLNVTTMGNIFYNCNSLTNLDVSNFNTSNVTDMGNMFGSCTKLTSLDVSTFDTSNVTDMRSMFNSCSSLTNLDLRNFDTSKVTAMSYMFGYCRSLTNLDISNFDTSNVTAMRSMFRDCKSLTNLDVSSFNTSKVIGMEEMFYNCTSLTNLDISNFDTSNVTTMRGMFYNCSSLTNLDVSNFNTSNVTDMRRMFNSCSSLTSLDLRNFDTSKVTGMEEMFYNCTSLTNLDLSNFDTSNVTNMESMFNSCSSLTSLDLRNFDTSKVTGMEEMFYNCTSLTNLDLSNFDTSNVTTMRSMFYNCSSLTTIYSTAWDTSTVTQDSSMFSGCNKLSGKSENNVVTPFDASRIGKEMATPNNGYFTVPGLVEWIVEVEYQVADGTVIKTESISVTQLNPTVSAQVIANGVPTGYELVNVATGWTPTATGQKHMVQVQPIEWTVEVEYQTADGTVIKTDSINVTQLNPTVSAQVIANGVPTGYELVNVATDWTLTATGQKHTVQVQLVEWIVEVEYQTADGTVIKTDSINVTQLNPTVSAQVIANGVPTGYELVNVAVDWTPTMNGEKHVVKVQEMQWSVMIEFVTKDARGIIERVPFKVGVLHPVLEAQKIKDAIPAGYEAVDEIQDINITKDGEVHLVEVKKVVEIWEGIVHFVDQNGTTIKTSTYTVDKKNPKISVEELEKALPEGAKTVAPLQEIVVSKDKEEFIIQVIMAKDEEDETPMPGSKPEGSIEGVQTGDATQVGLWTMLAGLSVGVMMFKRKRKKG